MPGTIDLIVAGLLAVVYPIWDYFVASPRMYKTLASGRPGARVAVYAETIALQWIIAAVIVALTLQAARPWTTLGLALPGGWRLALAAVLALTIIRLLPRQVRAVRRLDPEKRERLRASLGKLSLLIPRSPQERTGFVFLSVTAGICEELMYRGFLVWCLQPWLGAWGAALLATITFGLAHAYQGPRGAIRAGTIGALFALLAMAMHSIVPGMVLHALLDVLSGATSYELFAEPPHEAIENA